MSNSEDRSSSPQFTQAVNCAWVGTYEASTFHVGDKVRLRNANGSLEGPYLIATLPAPGKCTLSSESGQPLGNGEIDISAIQAA